MQNQKNIFIPGFEFSLAAGILTILVAIYITFVVFASNLITDVIAPLFKDIIIIAFLVILFIHYILGALMIVSAFLIKHEDHSLSGSIMALITSTFGLLTAAGILLGPVLGIVGGVLGLKEHQRIIKGSSGKSTNYLST